MLTIQNLQARGGDNAAPNYTNYTEKRSYAPHDNTVSISISGVIRNALFNPQSKANNAPIINDQTYFAIGVTKTPQGFVSRK